MKCLTGKGKKKKCGPATQIFSLTDAFFVFVKFGIVLPLQGFSDLWVYDKNIMGSVLFYAVFVEGNYGHLNSVLLIMLFYYLFHM